MSIVETTVDRTTMLVGKIIVEASEGAINLQEVLADGSNLQALGLTSLAQLRIVDAIEREFDLALDLEQDDLSYLDSLGGIVSYIRDAGG